MLMEQDIPWIQRFDNLNKAILKYFLCIIGICIFVNSSNAQDTTYIPQNGDIIFQHSFGRQGKALELATYSKLTHCGIVFMDSNGVYVLEAVQPVRIVPFPQFIARGDQNKYCVKRLVNDTLINAKSAKAMLTKGTQYLGKSYDVYFLWSDEEIYCSELVWKIYQQSLNIELCPLKALKEYNLKHPDVRALMQERYGKDIPWDEPMVAPIDLFNATSLKLVFSNM